MAEVEICVSAWIGCDEKDVPVNAMVLSLTAEVFHSHHRGVADHCKGNVHVLPVLSVLHVLSQCSHATQMLVRYRSASFGEPARVQAP